MAVAGCGSLISRLAWTVLVLLLLWTAGRIALRSLATDARFNALPARMEASGPAWGGPGVLEPILDRIEALGTVNLFDPRFEERIERALEEVPGVARVVRIRRIWPREYAVDLALRRPAAVVVRGESRLPVTAEGLVLPPGPYDHASRGLLEIRGVGGEAPAPGMVWSSPLLSEGLLTVAQISPHLEALASLELACIDVSQADIPRGGVYLYGSSGVCVRWGRPGATVGENPVERKIAFLSIAAARTRWIRGIETDVRFDVLYWREPTRPQPAP